MSPGQRAALPPAGFQPPPRLREDHNSLIVRFVAEDHGVGAKDYDFTGLPVSPALRSAFGSVFAERTRPGRGVRAMDTASAEFRRLCSFAKYLATLQSPPQRVADLSPAHVDGWYLQRSELANAAKDLRTLNTTLKKMPGISAELLAKVGSDRGPRRRESRTTSYSREEFDRILNTARHDVRRAASRIRAGRRFLAGWRAGDIDRERDPDGWQRGQVLDLVEREADVPRYSIGPKHPRAWVTALGSFAEHMAALHLTARDAAAFTVLLVGLTGQNRGTVIAAPAAHRRSDGYAGPVGTAIVELDKPRPRTTSPHGCRSGRRARVGCAAPATARRRG